MVGAVLYKMVGLSTPIATSQRQGALASEARIRKLSK